MARGWAKAIDIGDWGIITRRGWVPLSLTAVGASCESSVSERGSGLAIVIVVGRRTCDCCCRIGDDDSHEWSMREDEMVVLTVVVVRSSSRGRFDARVSA